VIVLPPLPGLTGLPSLPTPPSNPAADTSGLSAYIKSFENLPQEFERLILELRERLQRELRERVEQLRKSAEETLKNIWSLVPEWLRPQWVRDFIALVQRVVAKIVELAQALIEWVLKVLRTAQAGIDMYHDAVTWLEVRMLTNEMTGNLNIAVLNPNWIASGARVRQTAWTGPVASAFEGSLPRQRDAVAAIGLFASFTSGTLMAGFGVLLWIFNALAAIVMKAIQFVIEVTRMIMTRGLAADWFDKGISELFSWLGQVREVIVALYNGQVTAEVQSRWLDLVNQDNAAFLFRPDMGSTNVVVTWPDPVTQTPWPNEDMQIPIRPTR
jgi:hypothetical protein